MESLDEGLLKAIRENPDEDTARLIAADWLDEHEQPEWAELIRVQIELARMAASEEERTDEYDDKFTQLQSREGELLRGPQGQYLTFLLGVASGFEHDATDGITITRGFPDSIELCATARWLHHGDDTLARLPINRIYLLTTPTVEDREDGVWIIGDHRGLPIREVSQSDGESRVSAVCRARWPGVRFEFSSTRPRSPGAVRRRRLITGAGS